RNRARSDRVVDVAFEVRAIDRVRLEGEDAVEVGRAAKETVGIPLIGCRTAGHHGVEKAFAGCRQGGRSRALKQGGQAFVDRGGRIVKNAARDQNQAQIQRANVGNAGVLVEAGTVSDGRAGEVERGVAQVEVDVDQTVGGPTGSTDSVDVVAVNAARIDGLVGNPVHHVVEVLAAFTLN